MGDTNEKTNTKNDLPIEIPKSRTETVEKTDTIKSNDRIGWISLLIYAMFSFLVYHVNFAADWLLMGIIYVPEGFEHVVIIDFAIMWFFNPVSWLFSFFVWITIFFPY